MALHFDAEAGAFVCDASQPSGGLVDSIRDRTEREAILRAIKASHDSGYAVPAAVTGRRTAFHVLAAGTHLPDNLRRGKPGLRRFWRHVEQLRAMGHVEESSIRRADRHHTRCLVVTTEGMRACGQ